MMDFDGTITNQDTNDALFRHFGTKDNEHIEWLYAIGKIGTREGMKRHFDTLSITADEMKQYLVENITIDDAFASFHEKVIANYMPYTIVSGGFVSNIETIFNHGGFPIDCILANELHFENHRIKVQFYHDEANCLCDEAACGNCKTRHLRYFQSKGYEVIYIGDGLTDRCVAEAADIVFATGYLKQYCEKQMIPPHIPFDSFEDIDHEMFGKDV